MPPKILRGFPVPWHVLDSSLQSVLDLEVRDSDVFIVSYPKSGTIWLRSIINCMLNCPEEQNILNLPIELSWCTGTSQEELEASPSMSTLVQSWSSPRVMFTHLLPYLLPSQLFEKQAKVLYVVRNPKDVSTSYYHFFSALKVKEKPPALDEFMTHFLKGEVPYGFYFHHVKQYLEMSGKKNIMFVKYEDLKKDNKSVIKQVGAFLGIDLDDQKISDISDKCSFESMRKAFKDKQPAICQIIDETKTEFLRKGKVGDWRELLTVAQSERFDQLLEEHLGGTSLTFDFD